MKVLVDTNVIINFLEDPDELNANGEFNDDTVLMRAAIKRDFTACVSASAVTDIAYILARSIREAEKAKALEERLSNRQVIATANDKVATLLKRVRVLNVTEEMIRSAFDSDWADKEDAVQYYTAINNGVDVIVTWNTHDYSKSIIPVYTPSQFLSQLNSQTE